MSKKKDFSLKKEHKNPKGGLTKKGISDYNKATGAKMKPGVDKTPETPEELRR